jgi:hypothetical protein
MKWTCLLRAALIVLAAIVTPIFAFNVATADPTEAISPSEIAKILKRADETGRTRSLPSKLTEPLGASSGDETLSVQELVFEHDEYQHGFYRIMKPGDDRIILVLRTPEKDWVAFLADARFKLISSVGWHSGQIPMKTNVVDTRPLFNNEVAYWAALAEIL